MAESIDDAVVDELVRSLRLPPSLCRLLVSRGLHTTEDAKRFLRPRVEHLHDPNTLAGMHDAVDRLDRALQQGETVLVHGDYDVDGVAATALATRVLRMLGGQAVPFVPHRIRDGYDLGEAGLRAAAEARAGVILTVDCGIVAHDAVAAANAAGLDVIITDHHTPAETLPPALAVLNPNRPDCTYPNPELCGAGVAFKLCQELAARHDLDPEAVLYHLDLVALATVADIMPLTDENRVFTRFGLRVLKETRKPGLEALLQVAGLADRNRLSAGHVSHVLAPRINAVGRLDDAALAVRLLLTEDRDEAGRLAREADHLNEERQATDREILAEALETLESDFDPARDRAVVLAAEGWHPGVIGIVASRVVERVYRPTALIALSPGGDIARGSARSIPGFDLFAAIQACSAHLERFGGHRAAAGFDIRPDRVGAFREALNARAAGLLTDDDLVAEIRVDVELPLRSADAELFRYLEHMGPFGVGNPTPVFYARGVEPRRTRTVGEGHVKMDLVQDGAHLEAIGFRLADRFRVLHREGEPLDVAFHLTENHWQGRTRLQARLVDFRPAA